jgi:Ca-activated chloride channel family protein
MSRSIAIRAGVAFAACVTVCTARDGSTSLAPAAVDVPTSAPQTVFRTSTNTVAVYATVQDGDGRLVTDVARDEFEVFDNGKLVTITAFSNGTVPITAALLLDMSSSMTRAYFRLRDAAAHFVQSLWPADRLRIGTFGHEVAISPLLTGDKAVLARVLDEEVWPGGWTPLWRAAAEGMDSLAGETGRRVLVLITDGGASPNEYNCVPRVLDPLGASRRCTGRAEVRTQAQNESFMFYGVGLEGATLDSSLIDVIDETGGGHFDLRSNADLDATFDRVADELHHQYLLGFTPEALDGKVHGLTVHLTRSGVKGRARASYVAGIIK